MKSLLLVLLLILSGCTTKTQIIAPDGQMWEIRSGSDSVVKYTPSEISNGPTFEVDNRGGEGVVEGAMKLIIYDMFRPKDSD